MDGVVGELLKLPQIEFTTQIATAVSMKVLKSDNSLAQNIIIQNVLQ